MRNRFSILWYLKNIVEIVGLCIIRSHYSFCFFLSPSASKWSFTLWLIKLKSFQVSSSLNSSYCYILQSGTSVFTWIGNLTSSKDHDLLDRMIELINVCNYVVQNGYSSDVIFYFSIFALHHLLVVNEAIATDLDGNSSLLICGPNSFNYNWFSILVMPFTASMATHISERRKRTW